MKNLRLHPSRAAAAATLDVRPVASRRRPFRLWMTGSLAVVMASLCTSQEVRADDRVNSNRVLRHSRYGVDETLQRIEAAARHSGLTVLARMDGAQPVLVLASSLGGTLVVMDEADSAPDMPMSVQVLAAAGGGAHVLVAQAPDALAEGWNDLPAGLVDDLAGLPGVVERALA